MNDEPRETPRDSEEPEDHARLDVDAEFARIVEAYGDQPAETDVDDPPPPTPPAPPPPTDSLADRFHAHGWTEAPATAPEPLNTSASWDDEGHFVPPEPPPLGLPEPRRLAAWGGVFGAPLVMLLLVVFGVAVPGWVTFLLVVGFVGGFVFLVATMRRGDQNWPGDDGAVL